MGNGFRLACEQRLHLSSGQYRTARILVEGTVSFTSRQCSSVRRARCRLQKGEPGPFTFLMFNYPSIWNHIRGDHARLIECPSVPLRLN